MCNLFKNYSVKTQGAVSVALAAAAQAALQGVVLECRVPACQVILWYLA
jgi:hypothetical protein